MCVDEYNKQSSELLLSSSIKRSFLGKGCFSCLEIFETFLTPPRRHDIYEEYAPAIQFKQSVHNVMR